MLNCRDICYCHTDLQRGKSGLSFAWRDMSLHAVLLTPCPSSCFNSAVTVLYCCSRRAGMEELPPVPVLLLPENADVAAADGEVVAGAGPVTAVVPAPPASEFFSFLIWMPVILRSVFISSSVSASRSGPATAFTRNPGTRLRTSTKNAHLTSKQNG